MMTPNPHENTKVRGSGGRFSMERQRGKPRPAPLCRTHGAPERRVNAKNKRRGAGNTRRGPKMRGARDGRSCLFFLSSLKGCGEKVF